jgi:DNA-binding NarL/FixJ family response regulator
VIRVLIVDDYPAVRLGLGHLIGATEDVEVVGEAGTGEDAVSMARDLGPDVVLMDLSLPGIDGIDATRQIVEHDESAAVLVLTAHSDRKRTVNAIAVGAIGYLLKDVQPTQLLEAIRAAARGESPLDARAARALVGAIAKAGSEPELSDREREVVTLVANGLANKQIARELAISEKTVKNHLTRVFSVLGVSGRTEAAMWAAENGLVDA